jgi:hypothetical protein
MGEGSECKLCLSGLVFLDIDLQSDIAFLCAREYGNGLRGDRSQAIPKSKFLYLDEELQTLIEAMDSFKKVLSE